MSLLNPHATAWRPTGTVMTDLELPTATDVARDAGATTAAPTHVALTNISDDAAHSHTQGVVVTHASNTPECGVITAAVATAAPMHTDATSAQSVSHDTMHEKVMMGMNGLCTDEHPESMTATASDAAATGASVAAETAAVARSTLAVADGATSYYPSISQGYSSIASTAANTSAFMTAAATVGEAGSGVGEGMTQTPTPAQHHLHAGQHLHKLDGVPTTPAMPSGGGGGGATSFAAYLQPPGYFPHSGQQQQQQHYYSSGSVMPHTFPAGMNAMGGSATAAMYGDMFNPAAAHAMSMNSMNIPNVNMHSINNMTYMPGSQARHDGRAVMSYAGMMPPSLNMHTPSLTGTSPAAATATAVPNGLTDVDWHAEYDKLLDLTEGLIEQQISGLSDDNNTSSTIGSNSDSKVVGKGVLARLAPCMGDRSDATVDNTATAADAQLHTNTNAAQNIFGLTSSTANNSFTRQQLQSQSQSHSATSTATSHAAASESPAVHSRTEDGRDKGAVARDSTPTLSSQQLQQLHRTNPASHKASTSCDINHCNSHNNNSSISSTNNTTTRVASSQHARDVHSMSIADESTPVLTARRAGGAGAVACSVADSDADGRTLAPLTVNGNRRWKKLTNAQQRHKQAQKGAFEAFASALLHSISPFMAPLRERCHVSLPHLKLDQRFGKNGQPQTAIAQFIVAPLVTNYQPRHFHELMPGDLMEFHYDMAKVMKQLSSAYSIIVGYGPVWKRYAVPFCYVACRDYRREVLNLCPDEVPNSRAEAIYEDDILKDVTEVILAVEGLEALQHTSLMQAMQSRVNLSMLYIAFHDIFEPLQNYRIEIYDLYNSPSRFFLKTSRLEVEQKPQPITLYGDAELWYELPSAQRMPGAGVGDTPVLCNDAHATSYPPSMSSVGVASAAATSNINDKNLAAAIRASAPSSSTAIPAIRASKATTAASSAHERAAGNKSSTTTGTSSMVMPSSVSVADTTRHGSESFISAVSRPSISGETAPSTDTRAKASEHMIHKNDDNNNSSDGNGSHLAKVASHVASTSHGHADGNTGLTRLLWVAAPWVGSVLCVSLTAILVAARRRQE